MLIKIIGFDLDSLLLASQCYYFDYVDYSSLYYYFLVQTHFRTHYHLTSAGVVACSSHEECMDFVYCMALDLLEHCAD